MAAAAQTRKPPAAPPVYHPQPTPRVLQAKKAQGEASARTAAPERKPGGVTRRPPNNPPQVGRPNFPAQRGGGRTPPVCQPKAAEVTHARRGAPGPPAARPVANRRAGVVQPFIPVKYREWKEAHPTKGLADYLALVKNERLYAERLAEDEGTKKYATNLTAEAEFFDTMLARYDNKPKKQVVRALDSLVDRINLVLNEAHSKGYVNDFKKPAEVVEHRRLPVTDWEQGSHRDVIRTFAELVNKQSNTLASRGAGNPDIPVVPYSQAKRYLPWSACFLINKIYDGWKRGVPLDSRTVEQRGDNQAADAPPSLAVHEPGAMRSWHMDQHSLLPTNPALDATPANVQNFSDYVARYSATPNNVGHAVAPSGYIEYTGTGHESDYANFRILLDYRRGKIFISFHYQLWSINGDGPQTHGQNPAGHQDKNNPWINIDMNA